MEKTVLSEKYGKWMKIALLIFFISIVMGSIFGEKNNSALPIDNPPQLSAEEMMIADLTNKFVDECKFEAQAKGYELDIISVKEGYLMGNIKGLTTKTFSCKKLDKDGSISLTGSRVDLRVQNN